MVNSLLLVKHTAGSGQNEHVFRRPFLCCCFTVSGTVCPMLSATVLCPRTLFRNCWSHIWRTARRTQRLWRLIGATK